MKKIKNVNIIIVIMLTALIIISGVWIGGVFAYFTTKSSASGTITMGSLNIDSIKNSDGTEIGFNLNNIVPNQEFGGRYKAVVNTNINYYIRILFKVEVTPRSGATHKDGCEDNISDPADILSVKVGQTGPNIYTELGSKSEDGYAVYYKLSPTTPSGTTTDEVFDVSLKVHEWVGNKFCSYYMGATINVSMRVELLQADYLEGQNKGTTFINVQTMHNVWETCVAEPTKDVSEYKNLTFTVLDSDAKTMRVKAANSSITSAQIPSKVLKDGVEYSVTSIEDSAFSNCSNLTSVTIPNSVTSIGNSAFFKCSNLSSVTIPNSVTSIGYSAFLDCSRLSSVTIPNSVETIGGYAFLGCSNLTSINVDSNNANYSSENGVFYNKDKTELIIYPARKTDPTFTIPNSVTSIGDYAFQDCSNLTSVTIPDGVTSIGDSAFQDCSKLSSVTIPNSVETIGDYAFYRCTNLNEITISDGVTSIGKSAFEYCSKLTSVTIPNSVTSIGDWAFSSCSSLTSVTIPNSVTSIGSSAFGGCSSLTSVTIPNSVTSIGGSVFNGCTSLTSIDVDSNNKNYSSQDGVLYNKNKTILIKYPAEKTNTTFTIPNSVTSIESSAFENCSNLTSVTIPSSVTRIGDSTFENCSSLSSVTIPNSVTRIGDSTFENCSSLSSVTIPNSVTSIGAWAFSKCKSLNEITIPKNVKSVGSSAFHYCTSLTSVTIQEGVTKIAPYAFSDCTNLTSVTFNTSGWYATTSSSYTGGSWINVSTPGTNATNLKSSSGSWYGKYLYRK